MRLPLTALRSAIYFATSTGVKIASGLVVIKLMAAQLGPEGFGLLGQLMTVVAITTMLAGGGITNGVIKSLASTPINTPEGKRWLSTAFTVTTAISATVALAYVVFAQPLSSLLLKGSYAYLFFGLAAAQAIVGYGNLVLAEASSRGDSAFYAKINVIGTLIATSALVLFVMYFGFEGAAVGLILMPAVPGIIALHHALRHHKDLRDGCNWHPDRHRTKRLLSFSTATVIGATSVPIAHLVIREIMGSELGWNTVGHWQGVVKISDVYMQFVGVVLINYAIPRFAAAIDTNRALAELRKAMALLLGVVIPGLSVLYAIRDWAIQLVFSDAFLPMSDLLPAQMFGDAFRTAAASISFFFMARGHIVLSIIYEFLQGLILVVTFLWFQESAGAHAPVYAHLASNIILAAAMGLALLFWTKGSNR